MKKEYDKAKATIISVKDMIVTSDAYVGDGENGTPSQGGGHH